MTNWWMKMDLKMILYHKLASAEIFFTEEKTMYNPRNLR